MRLKRFLKERATVWRQSWGEPDAYGERQGAWVAVRRNVPCTFQQGVSEEEFGRQNREVVRRRVWFDIGTDVRFEDRLEVSGHSGLWHVEEVIEDVVLRKHHQEAVVVAVRV